jgi:hypothetical protein
MMRNISCLNDPSPAAYSYIIPYWINYIDLNSLQVWFKVLVLEEYIGRY